MFFVGVDNSESVDLLWTGGTEYSGVCTLEDMM
jgi:hypothetical protein